MTDCKTKAKWCEHAERYEDMVGEMTTLIKQKADEPLDEEERNLLSVAYKNVVGARRSSWRVVKVRLAEEERESFQKVCREMKTKIEEELMGLCNDVLNLLDQYLIPKPENVAAKIFYLKMKGDYYRYMVEICSEEEGTTREDITKKAEKSYQEALEVAKEKLPPTSPIRLGLALNYSVFFYEIKGNPPQACELAKTAFDDAIADLDGVPDDIYKDSTLIMQLLRDNLTLWKSELQGDQDQDATDD